MQAPRESQARILLKWLDGVSSGKDIIITTDRAQKIIK
jgi:hypothetical protein